MRTFPMCTVGWQDAGLGWLGAGGVIQGCVQNCSSPGPLELSEPAMALAALYWASWSCCCSSAVVQTISVFQYFRIIISYDNVILALTLQTLSPVSAQLRFVRLTWVHTQKQVGWVDFFKRFNLVETRLTEASGIVSFDSAQPKYSEIFCVHQVVSQIWGVSGGK